MKIIKRIAGFIVAVGVLCALASLLLWALIDIDQRIFRQRAERLLHDIVLGTVVINSSVRSPVAQTARTF